MASGSDTLTFTTSATGKVTGVDLQGGAILATEAAAILRSADLTLP